MQKTKFATNAIRLDSNEVISFTFVDECGNVLTASTHAVVLFDAILKQDERTVFNKIKISPEMQS